jgi:hypothetical protein
VAQALRGARVTKNRGCPVASVNAVYVVATVHPSAIEARSSRAFVADLRGVARLLVDPSTLRDQ